MNFRVRCSISVKKSAGILINCVSLIIDQFGEYCHLKLLNVPKHRRRISFHLFLFQFPLMFYNFQGA